MRIHQDGWWRRYPRGRHPRCLCVFILCGLVFLALATFAAADEEIMELRHNAEGEIHRHNTNSAWPSMQASEV